MLSAVLPANQQKVWHVERLSDPSIAPHSTAVHAPACRDCRDARDEMSLSGAAPVSSPIRACKRSVR